LEETTVAKEKAAPPAPAYRAPVKPDGGSRPGPGNIFEIEPIDLSFLPDFEDLTKRR
jgi:hypothetical protein